MTNPKSKTWWVVGLSVLAGSEWLLTEAYPSQLALPFTGFTHFALIGLAGLVVATRGGWERWPLRLFTGIAIAGGCVFVLPEVVLEFAAEGVSSSTSVALFCAVPVATVLGAGAFGKGGNRSHSLWPALVGLFGALLLFPVRISFTSQPLLRFATVLGCCVIVGLVSVWMHSLLSGVKVAQAVAVVGLAGAVALGLYGTATGWPKIGAVALGREVARCVAFDLPFVWLTISMAQKLDPVRLSARFLIAPLVTVAEGYAMVRGPLDVRQIAATALMAAGAATLLLKDEAEEVPGLRLR